MSDGLPSALGNRAVSKSAAAQHGHRRHRHRPCGITGDTCPIPEIAPATGIAPYSSKGPQPDSGGYCGWSLLDSAIAFGALQAAGTLVRRRRFQPPHRRWQPIASPTSTPPALAHVTPSPTNATAHTPLSCSAVVSPRLLAIPRRPRHQSPNCLAIAQPCGHYHSDHGDSRRADVKR